MQTKYICQLPNEDALDIYKKVKSKLYEIGFRDRELYGLLENAMSGRLCDLEKMVDIPIFLDKRS